MLHGVLNMPPELWNNDSPIDVMQRHSRYVQASKYIDELERELAAVTEQRDRLVKTLENIAASSSFDNINGWARNVAKDTLQSPNQPTQ